MKAKKWIAAACGITMAFVCVFTTFAASTDVIKEIQQLLNDSGYDCGTPDGAAGAKTIGAIAQYQEDHGMDITGEATEELLALLKETSEKENEPLLSSSGKTEEELEESIASLQEELNALQAELEELLSRKEQNATPADGAETTQDISDPNATTWVLSAGYYYAGVDIPAGRFNVKALSGRGNLSSSNLFNGGLNLMFGVDDGTGWYEESYNGAKLPEGEYLSVSGTQVVQLDYTAIDVPASGREYDEAAAFELTSGNYISGEEIESGFYNIIAVSGTGNLSSSNMFDGGLNEMFGIDDGTGFYAEEFHNISLSEGVELTVSGLTIRMIPAKK